MTRQKRKRKLTKKQRQRMILNSIIPILALIGAVTVVVLAVKGIAALLGKSQKVVEEQPPMDVELLTPNEYSRPQLVLDQVNGIVIHYTANPGTTAMQNRDYFEGLKNSHDTKASSHFIIGLEGEIVQCIPTSEISYASNDRNSDTISIECCHADSTGQFNDETYQSLVYLTAWLCGEHHLTTEDVIRHYDVTGKNCPKYYVEHEDAWKQFKEDVDTYIDQNGV